MKHPSSRVLFNHWDKQRAKRPAPVRADINPVEIRHALSDTFMLAVDFVDQPRFRLAGTRLCALFCRELKGELFDDLWSEASRPQLQQLLGAVTDESVGAVAGLSGRTGDGETTDLELLILPLARSGHARIRALGTLAPIAVPYWIGVRPIVELELGSLRHLEPATILARAAQFVLPQGGGRVRRGLVVHEGGRETPPAA